MDLHGYIKITDFGYAKRICGQTYTFCCTPDYVAPEVLLNQVRAAKIKNWQAGYSEHMGPCDLSSCAGQNQSSMPVSDANDSLHSQLLFKGCTLIGIFALPVVYDQEARIPACTHTHAPTRTPTPAHIHTHPQLPTGAWDGCRLLVIGLLHL
jgi:serine/threonine protein kinase